MKKLLTALCIIFFLLLGAVYIFVPKKPDIGRKDILKGNADATLRVLGDSTSWSKWWPGMTGNKEQIFPFSSGKEPGFQLSHVYSNGVAITIIEDSENTESNITVIPVNNDSIMLIWKCDLPESNQPIQRVRNYYRAKNIRNNMTGILKSLDNFLQKEDNIYGIHFDIIMSHDSTMVMTKGTTDTYPSQKYIYEMIGELKTYIRDEDALETNYPMLHIKKNSSKNFETMVAIPVNKELAGKGTILFSRFVPWKVLTAEVKGGVNKVEEALNQMELYINDHRLTRMAISFQSLETNRMEQTDSAKWVTRIYTPVP